MIAAREEAERWARGRYFGRVHIERHDGHAEIVPDYPQKVDLRREGFLAGVEWERSQEPSEAEIDAALPELIEAYRQESQLVTDRDYVARILLAARKAVTL